MPAFPQALRAQKCYQGAHATLQVQLPGIEGIPILRISAYFLAIRPNEPTTASPQLDKGPDRNDSEHCDSEEVSSLHWDRPLLGLRLC
jgi:hypothetical protein